MPTGKSKPPARGRKKPPKSARAKPRGATAAAAPAPASNERDAAQAISNGGKSGGTPPPAPAARKPTPPPAPAARKASNERDAAQAISKEGRRGGTPPPAPAANNAGGSHPTTIQINEELSSSYLDYAMSVIVSRALPDVCDGLKPVHRRILYAMHENKCDYNKPHRKSARVVGDVMGKYHPHGDQSIYDALVRMAQDFSMRLPLLDGQGNFGSVDGDPPAAMRYTEIRMELAAHAMLADIDAGTVDFQDTYDGAGSEPKVLPARIPNLLINGANGIAVGMATNVPPHNPDEILQAAMALLKKPDLSDAELLALVPGPDFPTGAHILNKANAGQAILTGRGSVMMRAKYEIEAAPQKRQRIVFTEIPYQVNKANVLERIAELVRDKQIEGVQDLRDESNRDGMRLIVELRRDVQHEIVLKRLFMMTSLQTSFGVNMLALHHGRPGMMGLRGMLQAFLDFREQVVVRRTRFELTQARQRAHILVGLALAVAHVDEIIKLIRASKTPAAAREALLKRSWKASAVKALIALIDDPRHKIQKGNTYKLSVEQAQAILDLRLQRLTALGREEIDKESKDLEKRITNLLAILRSRALVQKEVTNEITEIAKYFASPRRSTFIDQGTEVDEEDLIPQEEMAVTLSHVGYIKRVPLSTYRAQKRGGRGRAAMKTKNEDFVTRIYSANTHQPILFFSTSGLVYRMKVWKLPLGSPQARGKALVNLLPLKSHETIATMTVLPRDKKTWENRHIFFATAQGRVRRNELAAFENITRAGKIAMKLEGNDRLIGVALCEPKDDILMTTKLGRAIRFPAEEVRVFAGRASSGIRGMKLAKDDEVIGMAVLRHHEGTAPEWRSYLRRKHGDASGSGDEDLLEKGKPLLKLSPARIKEMQAQEQFLLSASERGYGKISSAYEYRVTGRGGQGIVGMKLSERTGNLLAAFPVKQQDDIMLVAQDGTLIRCPVKGVRVASRATQGVMLIRVGKGGRVASVVRLADDAADDADGAGAATESD